MSGRGARDPSPDDINCQFLVVDIVGCRCVGSPAGGGGVSGRRITAYKSVYDFLINFLPLSDHHQAVSIASFWRSTPSGVGVWEGCEGPGRTGHGVQPIVMCSLHTILLRCLIRFSHLHKYQEPRDVGSRFACLRSAPHRLFFQYWKDSL